MRPGPLHRVIARVVTDLDTEAGHESTANTLLDVSDHSRETIHLTTTEVELCWTYIWNAHHTPTDPPVSRIVSLPPRIFVSTKVACRPPTHSIAALRLTTALTCAIARPRPCRVRWNLFGGSTVRSEYGAQSGNG